MPAVQRNGDVNSAGGAVSGGVASVRINGKPVTVNGTLVLPHAPFGPPHPPHAAATTTSGVGSVKAGGIPINVTGNPDTCGHPRVGGSPDVRIG